LVRLMHGKTIVINMYYTVLLLLCISFTHLGCQSILDSENQYESCNPENNIINLIFKYGSGPTKNVLDTYQCCFTKDMVCDPPLLTSLILTKGELDSIYSLMLQMDFFNYPDTLIPDLPDSLLISSTPYSTFYFYVESKTEIKELLWQNNISGPDAKVQALIKLIDLISGYITRKESYLALPQPRCGYD